MTSIPTPRTPGTVSARPSAPAAQSQASLTPTVDPVKLVKKYKWLLLASVGAGLVLGVAAHLVFGVVYPVYTASVIYQCEAIKSDASSMQPQLGFKDELDRFMATQTQILTSDRIVEKAVADPRIVREAPNWSKQFMTSSGVLDQQKAARELKKNLSAGIVGESSWVRLSFWWHQPADAAGVARVVGRTYETEFRSSSDLASDERVKRIRDAIAEAQQNMRRLQQDRLRILQDQKVDTLDSRVSELGRQMGELRATLTEVTNKRTEAKQQLDQMEAELASKTGINYSDTIRAQAERNEAVMQLVVEINNLESARSALINRGLSPNTRDIKSIDTQIQGKRKQLEQERERLRREAFDAMLQTVRDEVASRNSQETDLLEQLEETRTRAADMTRTLAAVQDIDLEIARLTDIMAQRNQDLKNFEILSNTRVALFQDAQIPKIRSFPRLPIMMILGVIVGVGLVAGVIVLVEVLDQRVRGPSDVSMISRTRVLGLLPHADEDPAQPERVETAFRDRPSSVIAENFRHLRAAVLKRMHASNHKTLLLLSGTPGAGVSSVGVNLAYAVAAVGERVLLIDANFRRPAIHRILGLNEGPGLSDVLAGSSNLAGVVQQTGGELSFDVLTCGLPETRMYERLSTKTMTDLLAEAARGYDLVLIDVAPAMVAGDAMMLANRADASMLVVRALAEKRGMVAKIRSELGEMRADFLGVVVNAVRSSAGGYLKANILATHRYLNAETDKE